MSIFLDLSFLFSLFFSRSRAHFLAIKTKHNTTSTMIRSSTRFNGIPSEASNEQPFQVVKPFVAIASLPLRLGHLNLLKYAFSYTRFSTHLRQLKQCSRQGDIFFSLFCFCLMERHGPRPRDRRPRTKEPWRGGGPRSAGQGPSGQSHKTKQEQKTKD